MAAYDRVTFRGFTFNNRTVAMIKEVEKRLGYEVTIFQGSYNSGGVTQSAGTHDGGGAVDLYGKHEDRLKIVRIMREVGFAAWVRSPDQGDWGWHIHGIAIGDDELSNGARAQVQSYYAGLNGLANGGADYHPQPDPIPVFAYYVVDLSNITEAWNSRNPKAFLGVVRIQRALVRRGYKVDVDGILGPQTKAAFKKWSQGYEPTLRNLERLGRGYWRPKK